MSTRPTRRVLYAADPPDPAVRDGLDGAADAAVEVVAPAETVDRVASAGVERSDHVPTERLPDDVLTPVCVVVDAVDGVGSSDPFELTGTLARRWPELPTLAVVVDSTTVLAALEAGASAAVPVGPDVGPVVCGWVDRVLASRGSRFSEPSTYGTVLDTVPDGVLVVDHEGRMEYVNEAWAEIVDYDREELLGEPFLTLVAEGLVDAVVAERYMDLVADLLSSRTERTRGAFTVRVVPPDDTREHVYEAHVALLPFEEEFSGTAAVVRDVTDRERRREELERQNERLDRFAAVISHDLKNPLGVALGNLDLAADAVDEDGEAAERLATASRALDRIEAIVDDVLTLSRTGADVTDPAPVRLSEAVADARGVVEGTVDVRVTEDGVLAADPARFRRLLENLLANAAEHAGPAATVRLRLDAGTLEVGDDGPGVPADRRGRVFEPGFSTADDGTGLGLSIVRELADAHGWTVSAGESEAGGLLVRLEGLDRPAVTPRSDDD